MTIYTYSLKEIDKNEKTCFLGRLLMKKNLTWENLTSFFLLENLETHLKIINFVIRVFQCCLKRRVFIVVLLSAWLFNNGGVPKKMRGFTNIIVLHNNNETMYTIEIFKIYFKNVQTKLYLISNKFSWFQMRE